MGMNAAFEHIGSAIRNVIVVIICLYILLIVFIYLFQSRLIYFPKRELVMSPENVGIAYENIYFETKDGGKVHG